LVEVTQLTLGSYGVVFKGIHM